MKTKLLLVGSSGFLGRALYQQFSKTFEVIPTHTTNKVFENSESYNFFKDDIQVLLDKHSPDTVVMAAAVEKDPEETYSDRNYQARVRQFVKACQSRYVVYISSDALFDGKKGNYSETDLPSPITAYGRNLLHFETQLQTQVENYFIVRPSYLYGYSRGVLDSRLENARARLEAGEILSYFDDMYKSPLEVNQAAHYMTSLIARQQQGIVHMAGKRTSVYDFYLESLTSLGVKTGNLNASTTPTDSELPQDTSLDTSLLNHLLKATP
jgi:dTDP-4-dehydrorhamnose reductase